MCNKKAVYAVSRICISSVYKGDTQKSIFNGYSTTKKPFLVGVLSLINQQKMLCRQKKIQLTKKTILNKIGMFL